MNALENRKCGARGIPGGTRSVRNIRIRCGQLRRIHPIPAGDSICAADWSGVGFV